MTMAEVVIRRGWLWWAAFWIVLATAIPVVVFAIVALIYLSFGLLFSVIMPFMLHLFVYVFHLVGLSSFQSEDWGGNDARPSD
jgi:hypothetical protein